MAIQQIIESINETSLRRDVPRFDVGDTISVHNRIIEGNKERVQVFTGVVIARAGRGITEMITVRRIVEEQGVERVFPLSSPKVAAIDVVRRGDARRAKLYFLRERAGKSRRIRDRRRGMSQVQGIPTSTPAAPAAAAAPAKS
ncbi:MAG: 50S ribosomal protein L19 [Planctomyces sp.]|nr:50S ribosomal protein L19 [Planctomyces sp.]MBA4039015.1 50S ribosomal protein L19 [Planctomyces sp.]MBA4119248.1 50S ribosomal protein L19 [Isosphaera sp.]